MLFIVSGVHKKHIVTGLNIQNYMMAFDAVSREEAIGKYILLANEKFPEHDLFQRPTCMSIEEAQQQLQPENVLPVCWNENCPKWSEDICQSPGKCIEDVSG